ncbi:MAG: SDR family NAD(P)-dependent oxidoreductase [Planctomycetaceae bacterium]|jgi:NAD(P)-dependent dehydrogenase (short-subunit alcohol dehydrogenase family)|nr:SDR family NAD(P)-dependent oxidoreductase [Planctomycetaceae bacterium]
MLYSSYFKIHGAGHASVASRSGCSRAKLTAHTGFGIQFLFNSTKRLLLVIFVTIISLAFLNLAGTSLTGVNADEPNADELRNGLGVGGKREDKVWFITGTSSGFGLAVTKAVLARGEQVAATALDPEIHSQLKKQYGDKILPLRLDVTKRDEVDAAVAAAVKKFGRIDVVLNNAGIGYWGAVEELSEEELRKQFDVNFFGAFRVIQAVLPVLQKQQNGHIIQISSIAGHATFNLTGAYSSSKWAVEALSETVAIETKKFGIKVTIVEPGPFKTNFFKSIKYAENVMEKYSPTHDPTKVYSSCFEIPEAEHASVASRSGCSRANPTAHTGSGINQHDNKKTTNIERIAELEQLTNKNQNPPKPNAKQTELFGVRIADDSGFDEPAGVVRVILSVADESEPPLRVIVGKGAREFIEGVYQKRLQEWKKWNTDAGSGGKLSP